MNPPRGSWQRPALQGEGYLTGIRDAAEAVARGGSAGNVVDEVGAQLVRLLSLRRCQFQLKGRYPCLASPDAHPTLAQLLA
jgi:hypothetical protein